MSKLESNPEFFKHVKDWMDCDTELHAIQEQCKELKDRKKKAEEFILNAMDLAKEDTVGFAKGGNIRKSVSETVKPLKKEDIVTAISKLTSSKNEAESITENIYKSRPTSQRVYLKKNKGRKKQEDGPG